MTGFFFQRKPLWLILWLFLEEEQKELLCHTLCDILESDCCDNSGSYCLVSWLRERITEETASISGSPAESSCQVEHSSSLAFEELGFEQFHALIQKRSFRSLSELKDAVLHQYSMWRNKFGVLLFLYSVLLTKGIENIKHEGEVHDQGSSGPESFTVYHYNGLKQSRYNEKVMYVEGTVVVKVKCSEDTMLQTYDTPIKHCLQTKWPYIELFWTTDRSPSLNWFAYCL